MQHAELRGFRATLASRARVGVAAAVLFGVLPLWAIAQPVELPPGVQDVLEVENQARVLARELDGVDSRVEELERDVGGSWLDRPDVDLEKRFVDAQVFWDMKHYDKASILLFDLVESELFRQSTSYEPACYLLGRSLHMDSNFAAARSAFEMVVELGQAHRDDALADLVEIALDTADAAALEKATTQIRSLGSPAPRVRFALGKALYHLGRPTEARAALLEVPPTAANYGAARYYLGVLATADQTLRDAIGRFREALAATEALPDADEQVFGAGIREQSLLALGRLLSDQGDIDGAVKAYEAVDRSSALFERAMLELAWALLGAEKLEEARDTLDVLLLVAQDRHVKAEGAILRGRILERMGDVPGAVDAFQGVLETLGPLRDELDAFAGTDAKLDLYFKWLVDRRASGYPMPSPLSDGAASFIEAKRGLGNVVVLLDDVGEKRRDIQEMDAVIDQLEAALRTSRPIDVFPQLQAGWLRSMEAENSLIVINRALLDLEHAVHLLQGSQSGVGARAASLWKERHELEAHFLKQVPRTVAEYQARAAQIEARLDELRKEAFLARQQWQDAARQLHAMETWLAQSKAEKEVEPAEEQRLAGELVVERMMLEQVRQQIESIERGIELEAARTGVADAQPVDAPNIKNRIFELQLAEHDELERVRDGLPAGARRRAEELAALRDRAWERIGKVGDIVRLIEGRVQKRTAELASVVDSEKGRVNEYRGDVEAVAESSRYLAGSLGFQIFRQARSKVEALALEADVGILDAAWGQKEAKVEEIRGIRESQGQRLEEIRRALEELDAELGAHAAGASAAPSEGGEQGEAHEAQ